MKARLLPLHGKYYGSIIEVTDGDTKTTIKAWANADYTPSERELASHGVSQDDWDSDALVDDGWGGKIRIRSSDICSDGHFESKWTYELCTRIVNALTDEDK